MTFSLVARHCQLSSFFRARGRNLHSLHIDSTKPDAHERRQRVPDAGHGADISMSTGLLDYYSRITSLVPSEGWDYRMTATPPLSAAGPLAGHNVSLDCVHDGRSWCAVAENKTGNDFFQLHGGFYQTAPAQLGLEIVHDFRTYEAVATLRMDQLSSIRIQNLKTWFEREVRFHTSAKRHRIWFANNMMMNEASRAKSAELPSNIGNDKWRRQLSRLL